jgi:uncharacterized protein (UPF0248 family)
MKHARDVLNEIKWRDGLKLSETVIYYRDRVKPELGYLEGSRILNWDKSFIYTDTDSAIPFHRVDEIVHSGEVMFKRHKVENGVK